MNKLVAALMLLALTGGVAYATVPDAGGLIHACYDKQSKLVVARR